MIITNYKFLESYSSNFSDIEDLKSIINSFIDSNIPILKIDMSEFDEKGRLRQYKNIIRWISKKSDSYKVMKRKNVIFVRAIYLEELF